MLVSLFSIFVLGYIGYKILNFLNMPGSAIIGSLAMTAVLTSQGIHWSEIPSTITTIFQVIIGIMIGCRFSKKKLPILKSLFIPGFISSVLMILFSLLNGCLLAKFTEIDLGTALYASIPGGITEMGLLAHSYNLNVPIVTLFQFIRVISVDLYIPIIVYKFSDLKKIENLNKNEPYIKKNEIQDKMKNRPSILLTIFLGGFGGFVAKHFGIPIGGIVGAMVIIGIFQIIGVSLKEPPKWLIIVSQIFLGGYLGTTFATNMIGMLKTIFIPIFLFSIASVLNGVIIGLFFHRIFRWDLPTSLLATSAAGATIMSIIAIEINADAMRVSIFHAIRLLVILLIMPSLVAFILI